MMREKRKHTRHALIYKVIYSPRKNPDRKIVAKSFNISFSGIGLSLNDFIKDGRDINLSICTPRRDLLVRACGRLVWQNRFNGAGEPRAGLQFTEMQYTKIKKLVGQET